MAPRPRFPLPRRRRALSAALPATVMVIALVLEATLVPVDAASVQGTSTTGSSTSTSTSTPTSTPSSTPTSVTTTTVEPSPSTTTAPAGSTGSAGAAAPSDSAPAPSNPDASDEVDAATAAQLDSPEPEEMLNEGRGEEAPATDITVPPVEGEYDEQQPYEPPEILWSNVADAEAKLVEAEDAARNAIEQVRLLRRRRKHLQAEARTLRGEAAGAIAELSATTGRLEERAVLGYRWFGSGGGGRSEPEALAAAVGTGEPTTTRTGAEPADLDYGRIRREQRRSHLIESVLIADKQTLRRIDELRRSLDTDGRAVLDRQQVVADTIVQALARVERYRDEIRQAEIEYEAFKAGSEIFIDGVVFPIAGPYDEPFDSFGFPRMTGTPDEHWHEGIDLFAPRGTPLVATERAVVSRVGVGRLGGLKLWLTGETGTEWYYAHLDSFAPDLVDGLVVEAGQLVGYVGNTGNAVGTPPHLHMQIHPGGGDPVNPYPLLKVVSDLDRAAYEDDAHPGHVYEPVVVEREPPPEPESEPTSEPEPVGD